MVRKLRQSATIMLFPLVLVGCSLGSDAEKSSKEIDPPPKQVIQAEAVSRKTADNKQEQATKKELYFLTSTNYIAPYTVSLKEQSDIQAEAKEILRQLAPDSGISDVLPEGFFAVLPKGTKVSALTVDKNGKATVEFSKEFLSYDVTKEQQILQAITWSLTSIPQIKEVNIYVDGAPLEAKGKSQTLGLSRADGINVSLSDGLDITRSMPVTIYYLMQNTDKKVFHVPVTRMVNRTDDLYKTVIEELAKGPEYGSKLLGVLDSTTVLNKVEQKGDTLHADFNESILQFQNNTSSKAAINSIVLSLTENSTAKKVKITVDGKETITTSKDGKNVDLPVSRPEFINPSTM